MAVVQVRTETHSKNRYVRTHDLNLLEEMTRPCTVLSMTRLDILDVTLGVVVNDPYLPTDSQNVNKQDGYRA